MPRLSFSRRLKENVYLHEFKKGHKARSWEIILGDTAAHLLATAIEGNAKLEGIDLEVFDAD